MDISVIIPTLNEEKYLGQCLESIANQSYDGKYEVIIGDADSKDATHKIAEEYGAKIVIEKKPTISAGRQKACEAAKGRIVISTDADMIAPKDYFDKVMGAYNGNVGVFGNVVPYDGSKFEEWTCKHVNSRWLGLMTKLGFLVPVGSNLSFRKDAFEKIGGFNTDLVTAEDVDLVKRLSVLGPFNYDPNIEVGVSLRRVKGWGWKKYVSFHVTNAIKYHTTGKGHDSYEPIR